MAITCFCDVSVLLSFSKDDADQVGLPVESHGNTPLIDLVGLSPLFELSTLP